MYTVWGMTSYVVSAVLHTLAGEANNSDCLVCCGVRENFARYGGVVGSLHKFGSNFDRDGNFGAFEPIEPPPRISTDTESGMKSSVFLVSKL